MPPRPAAMSEATPGLMKVDGDLRLHGPWVLTHAETLRQRVREARPEAGGRLVAAELTRLDTTGAFLLLELLERTSPPLPRSAVQGLGEDQARLLDLVQERLATPEPAARPKTHGVLRLVARVGEGVLRFRDLTVQFVAFIGLLLSRLLEVMLRRRLRLTATVFHMEETGLDAVPIVALLTFLVGAVVAFVGASTLRDLGADVFTVDLVAISFLREFAVLLTAILLAGRSGSAFAAQIGSMKSREELDAIQALGLDAMELLVVPRLAALLLMLPALTFLAMLMGLVGGGVVCVLALDMTPAMYVTRVQEVTAVQHFWVGMVKAPVFAFLIAAVGCLEGFKVEGSAESVGRHTTSAVVQSIFLVIVADAIFAMCFLELDI